MSTFGTDYFGLGTTVPDVFLRDYQHASRMYVDNYYRLTPKFKTLYSVLVRPNKEVVSNIANLIKSGQQTSTSNSILGAIQNVIGTVQDVLDTPNRLMSQVFGDPSEGARIRELSALAHKVDLPRFTLNSTDINQYNKKVNIYTSIKYDPVNITFYDDNNNTVINLWNNYYKYFFGDPNVPRQTGFLPDVVKDKRNHNNWGFQPRTFKNFFLAIDFFSFNRGTFTMHSIMNPWITSVQMGDHEYGDYNPREITMQFGYSGVLYASGYIKRGTPPGFADLIYDFTPSPLTNKYPGNLYDQIGALATATGGLYDGSSNIQQFALPIQKLATGASTQVPSTRPILSNNVVSTFNTGDQTAPKAPSVTVYPSIGGNQTAGNAITTTQLPVLPNK